MPYRSDMRLEHYLARMTYELKCEAAYQRVRLALFNLREAFVEEKYRPDQPRAPKGTPEGGQWIDDPTSVRQQRLRDERVLVTQFDGKAPINLLDYEGVAGAHSVAFHVGKSDAFMLARVGTGSWHSGFLSGIMYRSGSFPSLAAANKLVNATLARNREIVLAVSRGEISHIFITSEFDSPTGREADRPVMFAKPYMRVTTGVGVVIVHDPNFLNGYRIQTAYPRSD